MDRFTEAYIECALWSSLDDGVPMDAKYSIDDLAPQTRLEMGAACDEFRDDAKIVACIGGRDKQAGHDFWLTRNHHGAGFWDGDWQEPDSDYLTARAHSFSECHLYVGDDGKLYIQ